MTREEAIAIFKGFKFLPREMKAVEMAIKALEQEHCKDAVSRQAVLDELRTCFDTHSIYDENNGENYIIYEDAVDMMEKLPPVTPKHKVGEWIYHEKSISTGFKSLRECSCCHCYFGWEMPRNSYCPNCGSDMRGSNMSGNPTGSD